MNQSWQLRPAGPADEAELAELMRLEVEQQIALAAGVSLVPQVDWKRYARLRLKHTDTIVWVAEANGRLCGFVEARIIRAGRWQASRLGSLLRRWRSAPPAGGVVEEIYVEPAWRRHGVATALVQQAVHELQQRQVTRIRAAVWHQNEASLRFGRNIGFVPVQVVMHRLL